jgi:hypothetical protein
VSFFFWPTRASSANQTCIAPGSTPLSRPSASTRAGKLFKILDRARGLSMMAGTGRELAITHCAQLAAQRLLGSDHAEFLAYPLTEIDDPPAHDAVNRRDWTVLDDRRQRRPVLIVQPRRLSRSLAIEQTLRAMGVELQHPIPNDLKRHAANPRCFRSRRSFAYRRQRQKPTRWRPVLRPLGSGSYRLSVKSARIGMAMANLLRSPLRNHNYADLGIPFRVTLSGTRYKVVVGGGRSPAKPVSDKGESLASGNFAGKSPETRLLPDPASKITIGNRR